MTERAAAENPGKTGKGKTGKGKTGKGKTGDQAGPTLTARLAAHIAAKAITPTDLEAAALFTLDAVANALAGRNSGPGRILLDWAGAADTARANTPLPLERAAFLMGALTHILETDDLHRASVVHPGCVVVPAAWMLADQRGASGRDLLAAVLRGFEVACRVGMAVGPAHYRIWHNTATCGPFGSAAAGASLLGLDEAQTVHALGNAGSQAAGLWQFLETGAMTKHLHAGHGAEAGLKAATLAAHGFTGPPAILEGEKGFFAAACPDARPDALMSDADGPWQLAVTSIKPWPSCRHTHPAIDAAQGLRAELEGRLGDIAAIDAAVYPAAIDVCDRPDPQSVYEAKFSLHHCIAAALGREEVDFDAFEPEARAALGPLREKVSIAVGRQYADAYPLAWGSAVTVRLKDGTELTAARDHAKGDPELPLSRDEMVAKARMLMDHGGVRDPAALIDAILALADNGPLPADLLNA